MLSEVFYWILNMSITASLIGLALLLLRRVGKIPRFVIYLLWNPVLIRLLLPIGISSRYSFMNLFSRTLAKPVALEGFSGTDVTMTNYVRAAEEYFPINYRTALLEQIFRVSSIIWLVGMITAAVILVLSYTAANKEVKRTLKPAGGYFLSSLATTPFVYGIFRPKIILPPDLEQDHARYVLAHEKIHIRRRDNLWRIVALSTACIHWFNPLIWYLLKSFYNDMEFACDEKAVKALTLDERKEYASVMLKFAAKRTPAVCSSFGGSVIRKRIEYVLNYRNMSMIASLCLSVFIIAIIVVLLTNPSP